MTLNTYKVVGITKANKIDESGNGKEILIAHCVSKDKIASDGYRVTSVFCGSDTFVGNEVYIAYVDKRDRIIKVK